MIKDVIHSAIDAVFHEYIPDNEYASGLIVLYYESEYFTTRDFQ